MDNWLIHHPDRQVLLRQQSQLLHILDMVGPSLNKAKSELEPVQNIQFLGLRLRLDQGRASLPISKAWEIVAHVCCISSQKILSYREVSQFMGSLNGASGFIPLGRLHLRPLQQHFHSLGLTNRFTPPCRSDPLILATLLRQWQDLPFLMSGIPIQPSQAEFTIFTDASTQSLDPLRMRAKHQCAGAQGGNIGPPTLGCSITGPSCFDHYRQYHCCSLHQQTGWDPFPPPVAAGSRSVSVVTDSGHNSVSQTHSGLPQLCQCVSRPVISAEPAHHNRVVSPP